MQGGGWSIQSQSEASLLLRKCDQSRGLSQWAVVPRPCGRETLFQSTVVAAPTTAPLPLPLQIKFPSIPHFRSHFTQGGARTFFRSASSSRSPTTYMQSRKVERVRRAWKQPGSRAEERARRERTNLLHAEQENEAGEEGAEENR